MPEEYVYKIVVDDAEIQSTLNRVDQRIKAMATQADQSFAGIGRQMSAGLAQTTQQAQQAAREVAQIEQRTGQQLQQTYGQVGATATQAYSGRQQAAIQAAQAEVRAAQEVVSAAKRTQQARRDEEQGAKNATATLRASAAAKGAAAKTATAAVRAQVAAEKSARQEIKDAEKAGVQAGIDAANERHKLVAQRLEDLQTQKTAAIAAHEEEKAKVASFVASEKSRGAVAKQASEAVKTANDQETAAKKRLTTETRAASREQTNMARRQRQGERAFIRTTKTFNTQRNALNDLTKRYGSFNVTLGKTSGSLNRQEQEVMDIIRSDKQLSAEIDKLIAKYGTLKVSMDRATFRGGRPGGFFGTGVQGQQVRQAGFAAQRFGIPGAAVIGEAAMVAGPAGIAVAGVLLSVQALTKAFISMGKAAAAAFTTVIKSSIEAAKELDVASAQFKAFFEGDTAASEAALNRLLSLSKELGENVVGIGRAFLPEVESLDQLEEVVKLATALARFQPEQGIMGARIALQEALSGEFRSLQRRFEISPVAIDKIREAYEASGVEGLLTGLQEELARTGRSVEDLEDTFQVSFGRVQERIRQLSAVLGEPIVEELKEQFNDIDDELQKLEPDLTAVANAFGDVFSILVDVVGTEITTFLESFDPEPLFEVVNALFATVDAFGLMLNTIAGGEMGAAGLESGLNSLAGAIIRIEGYFLDSSLALAGFREQLISLIPILNFIDKGLEGMKEAPLDPVLDISAEGLDAIVEMTQAFIESGMSVAEVTKAIEEHNQKKEDFAAGNVRFLESLKESGEEGERAANRFMLISQAIDELIVTQKEYAAVQEKVNEVIHEFDVAANLKFEKLLTNAQRKRMKAEIDNAEKLIDLERKNKQKIADIRTKFDDSIIDAGQELGDREADIARKHGDAVLDLEEDLSDKRLEAEEDYQEKLEQLRDKFNFDAFEAILANDAKRLRQIRRRQAFEEKQAGKERDKNKGEIEKEGEDRRAEIEKQLDRELRDSRIVNARKIRDLEQGLQKQLDKQEEARKRDIERQAIAEKRKQNELNDSLDQQLEDYETWWDERARVASEKIADDLTLMQQYVDDANAILNEMGALGFGINPLTGQFEPLFSMPQVTEEESPAMRGLRDEVVKLTQALEGAGGRTDEEVEADISALNVPDLVKALQDIQESGQALAALPGTSLFDALDTLKIPDIETEGLAEKLLREQALFLGKQVGVGAEDIVTETMFLNVKELGVWIDAFIRKYTLPDLTEFSLFPDQPTGIPGIPGGMSAVPAPAFEGVTPGQMSIDPSLLPPGSVIIPPSGGIPASIPGLDRQLVPANAPTGAAAGFAPTGVPAVSGQPQFIFPNVTDAPFVAPSALTQAGTGMGGVPTFEQMMMGGMPGGLMAGGVLPPSELAGFDIVGYQNWLDEQVDATLVAELLKRGEIEDTVAFAELMAEKEALAVTALLGAETEAYSTASDEQIKILEDTLTSHQAALDAIKDDPALAADAAVLEVSIATLTATLDRLRAENLEATQDMVDDEVAIVGMGLLDQSTAYSEYRASELDAIEVQEEEKVGIFTGAQEKHLADLHSFWIKWLGENNKAMRADLAQMFQWLQERQRMFELAIHTIPGSGTAPGGGALDDEDDDTATSVQPTLQELQNLATSHATALGLLEQYQGLISSLPYDDLADLVLELQEMIGAGGRALGGGVGPASGYTWVGENGKELVRFNQAARIDPAALFRNQPPAGIGGSPTTIDQSMSNQFSFPDPRGIPPTYIATMENIAAKIVKKSLRGR